MTIKQWWEREKFAAIHGQTWKFRVVKYCILLGLIAAAWLWKGWWGVMRFLLISLSLALAVHFFFRWKTNAWTQSWGPYKKLDLPK